MTWKKDDIITVPNFLSLLRLLMIPCFMILFLTTDDLATYLASIGVLALSSLTDCLDGYIARHFNQTSELGKFLDPLADKLTHIAVAFCLTLRLPWTIVVFCILIVKEIFMGAAGLFILKKNGRKLDGAKWYGKLSTIVFDFAMLILLFYPFLSEMIIITVLSIATVFLLLSFFLYLLEFISLYHLPPVAKADKKTS